MADEDNSDLILKLVICLIATASAAMAVTVYHCITTGYFRALFRISQPINTSSHGVFLPRSDHQMQQISIENSPLNLIPTHKYKKGSGMSTKQDCMCPVCLSEFEEGEELRTLPECMHSYHVACIDMWLYSHSNCPMCRASATPPRQMIMHLPESLNPEIPSPVQQQPQIYSSV